MATAPADTISVKLFKNNSVKIQCADSQMFRIVQKWFKKPGNDFYTFPHPRERSHIVVVKSLSPDITEEELKEELSLTGYSVLAI